MKNSIYLCLLVGMLSYSCKEDTQVNLINGTLYENCNTISAGAQIALKSNEGTSFNEPLILGSAISDQNGNFNLTYELEGKDKGTGDIILVKSTGFETLISEVTLNTDLSFSLYKNNASDVVLSLSGTKNYTATDTLFYSFDGSVQDWFIVQPANGLIDTVIFNVPNLTSGSTTSTFYYGLGTNEFTLSKEALSIADSSLNHIALELEGCNSTDTASVVIN